MWLGLKQGLSILRHICHCVSERWNVYPCKLTCIAYPVNSTNASNSLVTIVHCTLWLYLSYCTVTCYSFMHYSLFLDHTACSSIFVRFFTKSCASLSHILDAKMSSAPLSSKSTKHITCITQETAKAIGQLQTKFQNLNKGKLKCWCQTDGRIDRWTTSIHKPKLLCNPAKH